MISNLLQRGQRLGVQIVQLQSLVAARGRGQRLCVFSFDEVLATAKYEAIVANIVKTAIELSVD